MTWTVERLIEHLRTLEAHATVRISGLDGNERPGIFHFDIDATDEDGVVLSPNYDEA